MYLERDSVEGICFTLPYSKQDEDEDLSIVLVAETGDLLEDCYLCLADPTYIGYVSAKRDDEDTYQNLCGIGNANCYLGTVAAGNSLKIDFRFSFTSLFDSGRQEIPVLLCYGLHDKETMPGSQWCDGYGPGEWDDGYNVSTWQDTYTRCPLAVSSSAYGILPETYWCNGYGPGEWDAGYNVKEWQDSYTRCP